MDTLKGKAAFIMGGASGIVLGMAKAFVAAGMEVIIADIRQDHLEDAAQECVWTLSRKTLVCRSYASGL